MAPDNQTARGRPRRPGAGMWGETAAGTAAHLVPEGHARGSQREGDETPVGGSVELRQASGRP